jgi:hypothetical protein
MAKDKRKSKRTSSVSPERRAQIDRKYQALNKASTMIRGGQYAPGQLERLGDQTLMYTLQESRDPGLTNKLKKILMERGSYEY